MKTKPLSIWMSVCLTFTLSACVSQAPRRDFKAGERVQTIAVAGDMHLFAQDDVLLKSDSLDKQLAEMNEGYAKGISKAGTYETISKAAFIAQLAALAVCLGQRNLTNTLAWCGGSVVLGLAIAMPFGTSAERTRFGVVSDYNKNLK